MYLRFAIARVDSMNPLPPDVEHLQSLLHAAVERYDLYTQGIQEHPERTGARTSVRELRAQVFKRLEDTRALPGLPSVVEKLDRVLADRHSNAKDVARVVMLDRALAALVLRVANSALFGLRREIMNVEHAVVIVGMREIRRLVLASSVLTLFPTTHSECFDAVRFWEHSVAVAIGCRLIGKALRDKGESSVDTEDAALAGLLHDLGKIVMARSFPAIYDQAHRLAAEACIALFDAELCVFGLRHTDIGQRVLENWNIRDDISSAVGDHHEPRSAGKLAHILHAADFISHCLGFSPDESEPPRVESRVWEELDLSDGVIEEIGFRMLIDIEDARKILAR